MLSIYMRYRYLYVKEEKKKRERKTSFKENKQYGVCIPNNIGIVV